MIKVELTKPQAEALLRAADSYLNAASWQESIEFFGSSSGARAAERAYEKLAAATYVRR